jgi:hypothetical protein
MGNTNEEKYEYYVSELEKRIGVFETTVEKCVILGMQSPAFMRGRMSIAVSDSDSVATACFFPNLQEAIV